MSSYQELQESLIAGQKDEVKKAVGTFLEKGNDPMEILSEGLLPGMTIVGQRFKACDMFIPEVLASAHAMSAGFERLPYYKNKQTVLLKFLGYCSLCILYVVVMI